MITPKLLRKELKSANLQSHQHEIGVKDSLMCLLCNLDLIMDIEHLHGFVKLPSITMESDTIVI